MATRKLDRKGNPIVTKEELEKSGMSLRDFLNKERGLTRRGESKTSTKAELGPEMGEKMTPDESKAAASNFGYPKGSARLNSEENKDTSDMTYRHGGAVKKMNMGGMGYAKGGSASSRADGIATKGKTKGTMIGMKHGGKAC
jgi:hypothetical protein